MYKEVKIAWKHFVNDLREHAMEIINFKKKKMELLTNKQQKSYENVKICYVCQEKIEDKYDKVKKHLIRGHCHVIIQGNIEVLHIACII